MKAIFHEDFLQQTQGYGHPECPERLIAIMDYIDENEIHPDIINPEPAELDDILTVHSPEYLEYLKHFGRGMLDGDTSVFPHTYEMAMLSAGGGLAAAKNMLDHNEPSFAILRPPGHHATGHMGMGFCYINNIAVAANWLRKKVDKVAIVDIDVHHGNGTNDTFLNREDILFISTHQWGIYPGTGPLDEVGDGEGEGLQPRRALPALQQQAIQSEEHAAAVQAAGEQHPDGLAGGERCQPHFELPPDGGHIALTDEVEVGG